MPHGSDGRAGRYVRLANSLGWPETSHAGHSDDSGRGRPGRLRPCSPGSRHANRGPGSCASGRSRSGSTIAGPSLTRLWGVRPQERSGRDSRDRSRDRDRRSSRDRCGLARLGDGGRRWGGGGRLTLRAGRRDRGRDKERSRGRDRSRERSGPFCTCMHACVHACTERWIEIVQAGVGADKKCDFQHKRDRDMDRHQGCTPKAGQLHRQTSQLAAVPSFCYGGEEWSDDETGLDSGGFGCEAWQRALPRQSRGGSAVRACPA